MTEPRAFDEVADELIEDANEKVAWARKQAAKLLDKANDIEERAAYTSNLYRELAASMILEAQGFANGVTDILIAEFPMGIKTTEEEEDE